MNNRYVSVRFYLPGAGSTVEHYDRLNPSDIEAWDKTGQLYKQQIVYAGEIPQQKEDN